MPTMSPAIRAVLGAAAAASVAFTVYKASKGQKPHTAVLVVAGVSSAMTLWGAARSAQAALVPAAMAPAS